VPGMSLCPLPSCPPQTPPCSHRLQDLEREEETLSEKESVQEKLTLIQGFLQADVQLQLRDLEAQLRCHELSEERYLAQVKALLHHELSMANGAAAPLRAPNGCPKNGAYGSDEDSERAGPDGEEDGAMEVEEGAASSSSSSSSSLPRARKARRSRSNGESKSNGGDAVFR
ncbi:DNMT1 methyltransferase, partial [Calyptomena viridis]|nr:DNMT1 methyltransferase [Calyptomena viridis]